VPNLHSPRKINTEKKVRLSDREYLSRVDEHGWVSEAFRDFEFKMTNARIAFPCVLGVAGFKANQLRYSSESFGASSTDCTVWMLKRGRSKSRPSLTNACGNFHLPVSQSLLCVTHHHIKIGKAAMPKTSCSPSSLAGYSTG
jgi:hypothetical protein